MTKEITINPIGSPTVITFPNWKVKPTVGADSYVVLIGTLSDGFAAHGPFYSYESACSFADTYDEMAWIMEIHNAEPPKKPSLA